MLRRLLLLALLCSVVAPTYAQPVLPLTPRPAPPIPVRSEAVGPVHPDLPLWHLMPDSISSQEVARRMARIYALQAKLLEAEARGQQGKHEDYLEKSMQELRSLMRYPVVVENPRFRELYRTVVTEYQVHKGVDDTLSLGRGDIYALREAMFEALDMDVPLLENTALPEIGPMVTQVEMVRNPMVEKSLRYFLRYPSYVATLRQRAETYFPMIEQIFAEENVPDELKYLAIVESGLVPVARSWASAAGMWQFIRATGSYYGLDVTPYVDERLDPEKATRAAARHLLDLYEMFDGDWHLALAGYNCNPYRVRRAVQQFERKHGRKATFWDIHTQLPRETRNYVPMYIAAALVLSNPEAFGMDSAVQPGPRYAYDLVPVRGRLALADIARMADVEVDLLRALNPELLRGMTPPVKDFYMIRLPQGTYEKFAAAYGPLPEAPAQPTTYLVRRGDSLNKIARQFGIPAAALQAANNLTTGIVRPGQKLYLPVDDLGNVQQPQPVSVQYHRAIVRPIVVPEDAATAPATPQAVAATETPRPEPAVERTKTTTVSRPATHRVRKGDTLGEIARKYGVTVAQLRQWNNLKGSNIRVGQTLTVSSSGRTTAATKEVTRYKVQRGDALATIARRHGVTVNQLKQWNGLSSNTIRPGQVLTVRSGG